MDVCAATANRSGIDNKNYNKPYARFVTRHTHSHTHTKTRTAVRVVRRGVGGGPRNSGGGLAKRGSRVRVERHASRRAVAAANARAKQRRGWRVRTAAVDERRSRRRSRRRDRNVVLLFNFLLSAGGVGIRRPAQSSAVCPTFARACVSRNPRSLSTPLSGPPAAGYGASHNCLQQPRPVRSLAFSLLADRIDVKRRLPLMIVLSLFSLPLSPPLTLSLSNDRSFVPLTVF